MFLAGSNPLHEASSTGTLIRPAAPPEHLLYPSTEIADQLWPLWRAILTAGFERAACLPARGGATRILLEAFARSRLIGALATGKVSIDAVRKGMLINKVFSSPETFLRAHERAGELAGAGV